MNLFKNVRIGTRLATGFAIVLVLLLGVAGTGLRAMAGLHDRMGEIVNGDARQEARAVEMRIAVNQIAIAARSVVMLNDDADMQAQLAIVRKATANFERAAGELGHLFAADPDTQADEKAMLASARKLFADSRRPLDQVLELGLTHRNDEATRLLMGTLHPLQQQLFQTTGGLAERQSVSVHARMEDAQTAYAHMRTLVVALSGIALALGAVLAWWLTRGITHPLQAAVKVAQTVAGGDLTSRIEVHSADETGKLMAALKTMNDSLVTVVGTVRQSSDGIATGSGEIAAGNTDLSQRTEEQASNLQQTAASLEELTSTVKNSADTARQAARLAEAASTVAERGGDAMGRVVATMDEISASSRRIGDIIGVIDGIAFQTNILALNAAVEAARAGEQGRGFAVVAGEVRSLAQRSAEAAKEIKGLIGTSVDQVAVGARLVQDAGSTMSEIVGSVRRVTDLMGEISAATQEQTTGIGQINDAVNQLDEVTQQNAALVEESAAAADSLNVQARKLVQAVSVFRLDAAATPGLVTAAPPTARTPAPRAPARPAPAPSPRTPAAAEPAIGWTSF